MTTDDHTETPSPTTPETPPSAENAQFLGCLFAGLIVVAALAAALVVWFSHLPLLILPASGVDNVGLWDAGAALLVAFIVGGPAALGWWLVKPAHWRAVFRAFALLALVFLLQSLPRLTGVQPVWWANLLRAALLLPPLIFALWQARPTTAKLPHALTLAAVAAGVVLWPWLNVGALGSFSDLLQSFLIALAAGLFAGALAAELHHTLDEANWPPALAALFTAPLLAVLLGALGWAVPLVGHRLPLALNLTALGGVVALLALRGGWLAPAVLTTLVMLAGVSLFDAFEPLFLIDAGEVIQWQMQAGLFAAASGLLLSLLYIGLAALPKTIQLPALANAAAGTLILLVSLSALYFLIGKPGLYGDYLYVVLKDQPDPAELNRVLAAAGDDRAERLTAAYTYLTDFASESQAPLRQQLDTLGLNYTPFYLINSIEVETNNIFVYALLRLHPDVDTILRSPYLRPLPEGPTFGDSSTVTLRETIPWGIADIGANRVWAEFGVTGEGIIIGQSDSGADLSHPALRDSYIGDDYAWFDPWYNTSSPTDSGSHGTHTLGTIVGAGGIGVAPDAKWIACVNLGRNLGNPPDYLRCMEFVFAPFPQSGDAFNGDPTRAAHVLNNSWGCPNFEGCRPDTLGQAVDILRQTGVFVVASAGNDGPACETVNSPIALFDSSFTVGAYGPDGDLAFFSSRGPVSADGSDRLKPDIAAPGVGVLSSVPGGYDEYPGTSMAGPHVAGTVALMWSANPALIGDVETTERLLRDTARPVVVSPGPNVCGDVSSFPNNYVGYGFLDAYAAVQAALAYSP